MMNHLVLAMPIFALALFWVLPLSLALPLYLVVLLSSGFIYLALVRAMRRPVVTGLESLLGKEAEVVEMIGEECQVHVEGATWRAVSTDSLHTGDKVWVVGYQNLTLRVSHDKAA